MVEFGISRFTGGSPSAAQRDDLSRRQLEILDQLEAIYIVEGFRDLTIADLAERLNCSRRTLYQLAPNRTELDLLVIDRRLKRIEAAAASAIKSLADPFEQFKAALLSRSDFPYSQKFYDDVMKDPAALRVSVEHLSAHIAMIQAILDRGVKGGRFRKQNTALTSAVIHAALQIFLSPDFKDKTSLNFEQAIGELLEIVRAGILKPDIKHGDEQAAASHKKGRSPSPR